MNPTLFDEELFLETDDEPTPKTIEEKFAEFDQEHPEVYRELVRLAFQWIAVGRDRLGIATLFERLRWEWHVSGIEDRDGYRLNNNYRALYARKIMAENAELDGLFETRERRSEVAA